MIMIALLKDWAHRARKAETAALEYAAHCELDLGCLKDAEYLRAEASIHAKYARRFERRAREKAKRKQVVL